MTENNQSATIVASLINQVKEQSERVHARASTTVARTIISLGSLVVMFSGPALAQPGNGCGDLPPQFEEIRALLLTIQETATALAILFAAIMIVYAGFLFMKGSPEAQERARTIIVRVFIGLVIVLIASGMVQWVANILCTGSG